MAGNNESEVTAFNEMMERALKEQHHADEWTVSLLSSIAHSLAVIADSLREERN